MLRRLLCSTAIVLLLTSLPAKSQADETAGSGYFDEPSGFVSAEGGFVFNGSPSNASFMPDVDKVGTLYPLDATAPGSRGIEGRLTAGRSLGADWDYRVSLAAIVMSPNTSHSGYALSSKQDFGLETLDAEAGYRPDNGGGVDLRLFAGVRGLHSRDEITLHTRITNHDGGFTDSAFALGPRAGIDVAVPIQETRYTAVGSLSGSLLFGSIETTGRTITMQQTNTEGLTAWNVEGMAGVSVALADGADLTLGYRAAQFGGLVKDRGDIDKAGSFTDKGHSNVLTHGPFARLTVELR